MTDTLDMFVVLGAPVVLFVAVLLCVPKQSRPLGTQILRDGVLMALVGSAINVAATQFVYRTSGQAPEEIPIGLWFFIGVAAGPLARRLLGRLVISSRVKTISLICIGVIAIAVWVPFDTALAPQIQLVIVDARDKPVQGACAFQSWEHYAFEHTQHHDERQADTRGVVAFPERDVRASLARRTARPLLFAVFPLFAYHQSVDPTASVTILAPGLEGSVRRIHAGTTLVRMQYRWSQPGSEVACGETT